MRKVLTALAVAFVSSIGSVAAGADAVAMVSGGGRADFVPHPKALNSTGFTDFAAGVTIYADGTAQGHFQCVIPAIVAISGDVLAGWVNDDGSVTVVGLAHGFDSFIPGPFQDLPFTVTFREGGPGVGGFDYRDESGFFEPDLFDIEVIRHGMILIAD